jgi:hypothetical protein
LFLALLKNWNLKRFLPYFISLVLLLLLTTFLFTLSPVLKVVLLDKFRLNNKSIKIQIANLYYDYQTITQKNIDFQNAYNELWGNEKKLEKYNPASGWSLRSDKIIYPIKFGKNYKIVSPFAIGYYLDSNSKVSLWRGHAHSYTKIAEFRGRKEGIYSCCVYCYVSEDFNGDKVFLEAYGKEIVGEPLCNYDLSKKGEWQQLCLEIQTDEKVKIYVSFFQFNHKEFSMLNGFVVFAQPEIVTDNFEQDSPYIYFENEEDRNVFGITQSLRKKLDEYYIERQLKCEEINDSDSAKFISLSNLLRLDFKNDKIKNEIIHCYNNISDSRYYIVDIKTQIQPPINKSSIKNEIIENSSIVLNSDSSDFALVEFEGKKAFLENKIIGNRKSAWRYSYKLFLSYDLKAKIFGDGFNYLSKFGQKYHANPARLDYPHNPIISSFLYSGIIGGLLYVYFLIIVFLNYWKYRKYHMIFFLMYLVSFFFMMFSGNSHFSVPIFTFLSIIPFLTKYYIDKEKESEIKLLHEK